MNSWQPFLFLLNHHASIPPAKSSIMRSGPQAISATLPTLAPAQKATTTSTKFHASPMDARTNAERLVSRVNLTFLSRDIHIYQHDFHTILTVSM